MTDRKAGRCIHFSIFNFPLVGCNDKFEAVACTFFRQLETDAASDEFNKAPDDTELGAKIDGALKSRPEKAKG